MRPVVALDFYGTLARATRWVSFEEVLAEHGHTLDPATRSRWFNDGVDGQAHAEASRSREAYVAWQRRRMLGMLAETDIHPGEHEGVVRKLRDGLATRVLEAYDEVPAALAALRERGVRLAVCSNWDWDLHDALAEAGLAGAFDLVVSSAWVGARKPHPLIFERLLEGLGAAAGDVWFVGDSWGPDVLGPRAAGMHACYLRRDGHWPDPGAPARPPGDVATAADLLGVPALLD